VHTGAECSRPIGAAGHEAASLSMIPEKACPALDAGWVPVSRLREALPRLVIWLDASAAEGRSEKTMHQ